LPPHIIGRIEAEMVASLHDLLERTAIAAVGVGLAEDAMTNTYRR
jgi:hypothetical protein